MSSAAYLTYLFPLVIVGGIALYYVFIYRKGKAAGGGLMEGFAAAAREKWGAVLQPTEAIHSWGSGVLWRPYWQCLLASNFPILRLVWPTVMYQMVVTDQGRVLVAETNMLGGLKNQKAFPRQAVRIETAVEEKPGLAMKLNPLYHAFGKDYTTFDVTFTLPGGGLRLYSVPGTFLASLQA